MTTPGWLHTADGAVRIDVYVAPRAARTQLVGEHDGRLKMRVAAPPVDGAANQAIVKAFASWLGVSKGDVTIASGTSGRRKAVVVQGIGVDEAAARLGEVAS